MQAETLLPLPAAETGHLRRLAPRPGRRLLGRGFLRRLFAGDRHQHLLLADRRLPRFLGRFLGSPGLGGYLAARTDAEHYAAEELREHHEVDHMREREIDEVEQIFREYGLEGDALKSIVDAVASNRQRWVDFMMRFELGLERPDPKRAPISAATIGGSYVLGGLIPLVPYMFTQNIGTALQISVAATGVALLCFGAVKGHFTGVNKIKSALQTLLVGGLAAGAAYWLAHLFG